MLVPFFSPRCHGSPPTKGATLPRLPTNKRSNVATAPYHQKAQSCNVSPPPEGVTLPQLPTTRRRNVATAPNHHKVPLCHISPPTEGGTFPPLLTNRTCHVVNTHRPTERATLPLLLTYRRCHFATITPAEGAMCHSHTNIRHKRCHGSLTNSKRWLTTVCSPTNRSLYLPNVRLAVVAILPQLLHQ